MEARMGAITVLTDAFLIDCTGKEPTDGAAVVIEGERIKDVIRSGKVGPLKGRVETLSLKGRTLMPGLTDAHVHVCAVEGNPLKDLRVFQSLENLHLIMKGGQIYKRAL